MDIILLRHGKPMIAQDERCNSQGFHEWLSRYDTAAVDPQVMPDPATLQRVKAAHFVVCSGLSRSIDSARLLGLAQPGVSDARFNEAALPRLTLPWVSLTAKQWLVISRCAWFVGQHGDVASHRETRERAGQCAEQLIHYAELHRSVLLVGHGVMNHFIAKALSSMGWQAANTRSEHRYWSATRFSC